MKQTRAWAIAEVTVEVQVGPWGGECTIAETVERGAKEAVQHLRVMTQMDGKVRVMQANVVRVVSESAGDE